MSIEAMKQTLSDANAALKKAAQCIKDLGDENERLRQAITRAESTSEAEPSQGDIKQEPVAWMDEKGSCVFFDEDKPNPMDYSFWKPLYTHPQPKQEPIAWIFEDELPKDYPYDGMFPYSKVDVVRMFPVFGPQPKREWVGLTDEEADEIQRSASYTAKGLLKAIEAKLKAKNFA